MAEIPPCRHYKCVSTAVPTYDGRREKLQEQDLTTFVINLQVSRDMHFWSNLQVVFSKPTQGSFYILFICNFGRIS